MHRKHREGIGALHHIGSTMRMQLVGSRHKKALPGSAQARLLCYIRRLDTILVTSLAGDERQEELVRQGCGISR
ncbi:MAG: hypothetical protein KDE58_05350, partial [Caldilineaceae bacterium]|nr:hypothetical protein [Caldilineaceae bacterium]